MTGAIGTELINILLICTQDTVKDVIMNFIALGVIAEIDDLYAGSLYNNPVKDCLEKNSYEITAREDGVFTNLFETRATTLRA